MKKQLFLTIAVVLTPLTVVTQKIQHQHNRLATEITHDAEQAINHNAYNLPLKANASIFMPETMQYSRSKIRPFFYSKTVFREYAKDRSY